MKLILQSHLTAEERKTEIQRCYRAATDAGQLFMIQYLETHLTVEECKEIITDNDYKIILTSTPMTSNGVNILKHFEAKLTAEELKKILKHNSYFIVRRAVRACSVSMLQHLETHLTAEELRAALKLDDYAETRGLFQTSMAKDTLPHLLQIDTVLAYLESQDSRYGKRYIYAYVEKCLQTLRRKKAAHELANPQIAFDLNQDDARHAFYLLRNLIRRGAPRENSPAENHLYNIKFLLSIPAINNLRTECINPQEGGEKNELLNLALKIGNQAAVELLTTVPAAHLPAEEKKKPACEPQRFFAAPQAEMNIEEENSDTYKFIDVQNANHLLPRYRNLHSSVTKQLTEMNGRKKNSKSLFDDTLNALEANENFVSVISETIPDIPVVLDEHVYDLNELLNILNQSKGVARIPHQNDDNVTFTLIDITSGMKTQREIWAAIEKQGKVHKNSP